jgi:ParB/Sulfiredoxin domain
MLRFDQVIRTSGRASEHDVGTRPIALASIVGTVDRRGGDFDQLFRPRTGRLRSHWQRIAAARRRGETMPPIDVYRVDDLYFVIDGHHRVSVARAQGDTTIDAHIREVQTTFPAR